MRTLNKKSDKVLNLVREYRALAIELNKAIDEVEKAEKERNKTALKIQKIKDKMNPLTQNLVKADLQEFEMIVNVKEGKDETVDVDVIDQVEQFKEALRKKKA